MLTLPEATGSLLFASAETGLAGARILWKSLPPSVRQWILPALKWKGLAYALNHIASYDETHSSVNFAGNLAALHEQYPRAPAAEKERLSKRFDKIMDSLVIANGVQKTTYAMRQHCILAKVLADERCRPRKAAIRVLDVPSSSGVAALDSMAVLRQYYAIRAYVLGDLAFDVYYDTERECIFDEDFNLLQVRLGKRFFSIYRGHRSGDVHTPVTAVLLFPLDVAAWYLKKKYRYSTEKRAVRLSLLHPEVDGSLARGDCSVRRVDVFNGIGEHYDLILSFNFLQRNYFPPEQIAHGIESFTHALDERGFLIMGNDECFSVAQKRGSKLVVIKEEGVHGTIGSVLPSSGKQAVLGLAP